MTRRIKEKLYLLPVVVSLAMGEGCDLLNPDRQLMTRDGVLARLAEDNQIVRGMLSAQKNHDAEVDRFSREDHSKQERIDRVKDMIRNPELYTPGRKEFLLAMSRQPGFSVPGSSYARLLDSSEVKCDPNPGYTPTFVKIRITSGPMQGHEGWVCENDIFRTVVWP